MANVILTSAGFVEGPAFPQEDAPMAEQAPWPRTLFSKDEPKELVKDSATGETLCGSRLFQSQEEVDAAGGNAVWKATPQEAATTTPPPTARPTPPVPPTPEPEEDEPHAPRSRR